MNPELIRKIANAVLYEGYLLYPYRASAVKNRHRWTFGSLYPPDYCKFNKDNDFSFLETQCLLSGNDKLLVSLQLRFLHLMSRETDAQTFQQAAEREFEAAAINVNDLATGMTNIAAFEFPSSRESNDGAVIRQEALKGTLEASAIRVAEQLFKLTVRITNRTDHPAAKADDREEALMRSLVSTHCILSVRNGKFLSLLDPPDEYRELAAACKNTRCWPVLVGEDGDTDAMLASPIILYDYPKIAPESAGDLFDSTEIDEILTLRILTLTEEEKEEMRNVDERARKLLERTEALPPEQLMKLHGAVRGLKRVTGEDSQLPPWDPWESKPPPDRVRVFGKEIKKGARVKLWPVKTADILDMALTGKIAIVEAIEEDYEGTIHLAVVVEDDPGKDMGELRQPGHRFFFTPEEVEPL